MLPCFNSNKRREGKLFWRYHGCKGRTGGASSERLPVMPLGFLPSGLKSWFGLDKTRT